MVVKEELVPSIPKDSPFAGTSLSGLKPESTSKPSGSDPAAATTGAATAQPFSFSFSLGAGAGAGKSVATFDLAAPIAAADSTTPAVTKEVKSAAEGSRKIARQRRGKTRVSHEDEGALDEVDGFEEGDENGAPSNTAGDAAAATAALPLAFDSSKFDLRSFAANLPPASVPTPLVASSAPAASPSADA